MGVGTTAWAVLDEVGEVRGARDKAYYFTLVELFCLKLGGEYSRLSAELIVVYYINGTMIRAYNLDPNGIIESWLVSPVIWWRMAVWKQGLPHVCIASHAVPVPLPPSHTGPFPLLSPPGDRDAVYVVGNGWSSVRYALWIV